MRDKNGNIIRTGSRIAYHHACVGWIGSGERMRVVNGWPTVRCHCGDTVFLAPENVERVKVK